MATSYTFDDLARFGGGAIDEFLFGLPEYAAKKLGNREKVEEWIAKSPRAWKAGETAGTVASMFLPFGKLGAGGKAAAQAAKGGFIPGAVQAAKRGVDWGKIAQMAKRGALFGAGEAGLRGITSEKENPFDEAKRGAMFGAAGGAVAGSLGQALPKLSRYLKKQTEKAVLGRVEGPRLRDFVSSVQKLSGPGAGPGYQTTTVGGIRREMSDLVKKGKLFNEEMVERAYSKNKAVWSRLDDAFESVAGGKKASEFLRGILSEDDLARLAQTHSPATLKKAVAEVMQTVGDRAGLAKTRETLDKILKFSRTAPASKLAEQNYADALGDVAGTVRGKLDDAVISLAERSGEKIPEGFKREWGLLQPFFKGEVRSEIGPSKFGLGSPTFEKMAASSLLGGAGFLGPGETEDKVKRAIAGAVIGGLGTRALSKLATRGVGGLDTLAGKLEAVAPRITEEMLTAAGGRMGGALAGTVGGEAKQTKTEEKAQAADIGAEAGKAEATGDMTEYRAKIDERIQQYWTENGGEAMFPGQYKTFRLLIEQSTDGFDPKKSAAILFPDKDRRKKFLDAYEASRTISQSLPRIGGVPGSLNIPGQIARGFRAEDEKAQEEASLAALQGVIANALKAGGDPDYMKRSRALLQRVVDARGGPEEKTAMLRQILGQLGIDFETLTEAGIAA